MRKGKGLFLTFEGIDCCGKSTQIKKTAHYFNQKGIPHIVTREPGGTPLAEKIREIILSPKNSDITNSCELLLYLASRAQHMEEKIIPTLESGAVVLCDRFQEATFAYQGFGRGFSLEVIKNLNDFATGGYSPTRTYIFDISVECAFERLKEMDKTPDRLESNSKEFYRKIREGYLALASNNPTRIKLLRGDKSIDQIFEDIRNDLDSLL